jgi:hypothetical protein
MNVSNYVGTATYLFDSPNTLLFGATINTDTNQVIGTWCESSAGWSSGILGSIGGAVDKKVIDISAELLPLFKDALPGGPMTASGAGRFKNASGADISGTFDILYAGMLLPSLLTATREE